MTLHVEYLLHIDELPVDCIKDCSASGDVFEAVSYWCDELGFTVSRTNAERCLKGYGAWDDLHAVDDRTIAERVLWLACGDFSEWWAAQEQGHDNYGSDIFCLEG